MVTISNKYKHGDIVVYDINGIDFVFVKVLIKYKISHTTRKVQYNRTYRAACEFMKDKKLDDNIVIFLMQDHGIGWSTVSKIRYPTKAELILYGTK